MKNKHPNQAIESNETNRVQSFRRILTFVTVIFLLSGPCLLFGLPGFYGDDLSLIASIATDGPIPTVQNWIEVYGSFYRPLGFSILITAYDLLSSSMVLLYAVAFSIYALVCFCLFRFTLLVFDNETIALFSSVLFAFCPFAYTAILQLSSLYMLVSFVFTLCVFEWFVRRVNGAGVLWHLMFGVLWFTTLLIYEQAIALTGILIFLSIRLTRHASTRVGFVSLTKKSIVVLLPAILFTLAYVSSEGNPKIQSISSLNELSNSAKSQQVESVPTSLQLLQEQVEDSNIVNSSNSNSFYGSRTSALVGKVSKVSNFFIENANFALTRLIDEGPKSALLLLAFVFLMIILVSVPLPAKETNQERYQFTFGILWVLLSLLPFTLYASFHVPVYALLLPWMGGAFLIAAATCLLRYMSKHQVIIKNTLLFTVCGFLYLQQIGVYFGLKDQLHYWSNKAVLEKRFEKTKRSSYESLRINAPATPLFWLEKAIIKRHFNDVQHLDEEIFELDALDHSIRRR